MAEQTELKPVDSMTKPQLREELEREYGETPSGSITAIQLRERLAELRAAVDTRDGEPDEPETVDVEPSEEEEVEPTAEEAERAAGSDQVAQDQGASAELAQAETMALELRERAVGPTQTIPALAELNAISVVAERLAMSQIVPTAYRRRPDDIVAAILMGRELGIGPMQSLKDIAVIDGRPALAAHLQLAVLRRGNKQGHVIILESSVDDDRAWIRAQRTDTKEIAEVEWTYEEAQKVKRKGGTALVDGDNWKNYRRDMLWARCVGRLTRRLGSDLVAGMPYTAEEVRDFDDDPYGYNEQKPMHAQDAPQRGRPGSRAELLDRFTRRFGEVVGEREKATAAWFIKEALRAGWKVDSFAELGGQAGNNEAFQKISSAVMLLEESDDLAFATGVREKVAKAFAEKMEGLALIGPPWRLGPDEENLPTWEDHKESDAASAAPAPSEGGQDDMPLGEDDIDVPFGEVYG